MRKNEKTIQVTTTLTQKDYHTLKKLSAKTGEPIAQIMRTHILDGLTIEKSKDDIDFIRKQLREELEIAFEQRMSRIIKLLIKIGGMAYVSAYYSAMMTAAMTTEVDLDYRELIENAKREGAKALGIRSEAVDELFEEMMKL